MRIAIASSGLGHIPRGVEAWAEDLAIALRQAGQDVTLFQGGGKSEEDWRVCLPCLRRFEKRTDRLVQFFRGFGGWRYGMGSEVQIQETTFAFSLWRMIKRDYEILHLQDPWLALLMDRMNRIGLSRPKVILAHGTEETPEYLRKFTHLQHLTPMYNDDWQIHRPPHQFTTAIPISIDIKRFRPGNKEAARTEWDLPADAYVVICVAALKKTHKRCDYVIREFAEFNKRFPKAILVLAGARETETDEIMQLADQLGNGSIRVYPSVPRDKLLSLYQAADIFVLGSLWEMMGIVVLEALACGVPAICHTTPAFKWILGDAGLTVNLSERGALCEGLASTMNPTWISGRKTLATKRVEDMFSHRAVVEKTLQMYRAVLEHRAVNKP